MTHHKKLEKLNKGPVGQDYKSLKTELIHNKSSYNLTPVEERILCRGWNFSIENKLTNFINFKTDVELNIKNVEPLHHPNVSSGMS